MSAGQVSTERNRVEGLDHGSRVDRSTAPSSPNRLRFPQHGCLIDYDKKDIAQPYSVDTVLQTSNTIVKHHGIVRYTYHRHVSLFAGLAMMQ